MTTSPADTLPAFLQADQALEMDSLPLQVLLLTQHVAELHQRMQRLSTALLRLSDDVAMPNGDVLFGMGP